MNIQRLLLILGIFLVILGLGWPWISRLPLGRLPGDLVIDRPNMKIYFPVTTMILLSLIVSILYQLYKKMH